MTSERTAASIAFLRRWAPDGPWVLTALCPHQGHIRTRAFTPDQLDAMAQWIEGWQQGGDPRNLYFQPNTDRPISNQFCRGIQGGEALTLFSG